jgi:hypothetical protein
MLDRHLKPPKCIFRGESMLPAAYPGPSMCNWAVRMIIATAACGVTLTASSMPAARQSRILVVHVRTSGSPILEEFRVAATSAGLNCRSDSLGAYPRVACYPRATSKDFRGSLEAVDVIESKKVVISAYSNDVFTPHGELDPAIEKALKEFKKVISGQQDVESVEDCVAPNYQCSRIALLK